jgi:hypothetical protein
MSAVNAMRSTSLIAISPKAREASPAREDKEDSLKRRCDIDLGKAALV